MMLIYTRLQGLRKGKVIGKATWSTINLDRYRVLIKFQNRQLGSTRRNLVNECSYRFI